MSLAFRDEDHTATVICKVTNIYPVLNGNIGLASAVLESFCDFFDEKVEVLSEEEIQQQNATRVADVTFEK